MTKDAVRAVAYFRYNAERGVNSPLFRAKKNAYLLKIEDAYGWIFSGCYADGEKKGERTPTRAKRNQMLEDAKAGKFDYVVADSVQSLGDSFADSFRVVTELRKKHIYVRFESNGLDTRDEETMEVLRLAGENVLAGSHLRSSYTRKGIRERYEKGIARWSRLFGYRSDETSAYEIVEEEAEVVRMIFDLYLNGASMTGIKGVLEREGIPSPQGKDIWKPSAIKRILDNERYAGGILLQKYISEENLSGKTVMNDGSVVPQYMIWEHHTPIVSREDFEQATMIRAAKRRNHG